MPPMSSRVRLRDTVRNGLSRAGTTPADAALAVGVALLVSSELLGDVYANPVLALPLIVLGVPTLAWRRRYPVAVAIVVCGLNLGFSATAPGQFPPQLFLIPLVLAVYAVAAHTGGRTAFEHPDGALGRLRCRKQAAIALHHHHRPAVAGLGQQCLETLQIGFGDTPGIRIDDRGRGSLIFAGCGRNLA